MSPRRPQQLPRQRDVGAAHRGVVLRQRLVATNSTADAVRTVGEAGADGGRDAAIGTLRAAELYGCEVLAADIADTHDNSTRFVLLGTEPVEAVGPGRFRTSIICGLQRDRPGALLAILQEFAGACLIGIATRFALVLVLLGDGSDGKSTIGKVVAGIMPDGTVAAVAPQLWGSEYRRAQLRGVHLNVVAELPEADILDAEAFKAIVAGDPTDAREIREAPFMLRPRAGHLFSTNRLPGTRDLSHGFWRRLCVLKCSRKFTQAEADTEMPERLLAEERPALVAWALEGAVRLLGRGRYVLPSSSAEHTEAWRKSADVVGLFIEDRLDRCETEGVAPMALYRAFRDWAEDRGFKPLNVQKFGQRMAAHGLESAKGTKGARGYPVRLRHGVDQ